MKKYKNMVVRVRYWEGLDFGYMELVQNVDLYKDGKVTFIEPFSINELGQKRYYSREVVGEDVEIMEILKTFDN